MVRASDLKTGMVLHPEKNLYKIFHFGYHTGGGSISKARPMWKVGCPFVN